MIAVNCNLYFAAETAVNNLKAVVKIATSVMRTWISVGVMVGNKYEFVEATALVENNCAIAEKMVMAENSYGTVEEMEMVVSSYEIAEVMVKVENNCLAVLAEGTSENNSVIFEVSVSSASNW